MEPREFSNLPDQWHNSAVYAADALANVVDPFTAGWIALGAGLVFLFVAWVIHTPAKRGKTMGKNDSSIVANILTRSFDEAVEREELTAKRARRWLLYIGRTADIPDLQTFRTRALKKVHPYRITEKKEEIKTRLANGLYKDKDGKKKVVKIPGDVPIQLLTKEDKKATFKKLTTKKV